ncbi:class II glutamine amidotransferase [Psychrosphaera sp. B3R10]|uniref:class II glutamine amidotransferase n=1 Tax=unclassified Psychrosphaera TaxID=2641570 RepID=UPI001C09D59D|nr:MULTISPECIES: class II glutamine amidotransferase [unclassified Psychrosphaera]MBU2881638.1 class II glutamine amidotransferase [Psychrosphaera sp. I2R16]MBU2991107.1 class II glutamine amidotransferase [Psychrosphaera sp. B3R10]
MCELLGMSANVPTDIVFSFTGLVQRGGKTGPHTDGWGITFYEGKGCRTFKDPRPSAESKIANLVMDYPIKSCSVISHIRQANRGGIKLENTHPFIREFWGRHITFAHNGQLSRYKKLSLSQFHPVGDTDSEFAFCWIMDQLKARYKTKPRNWQSVFKYIAGLCKQLNQYGVFNALISDGEHLLAYCSNNLSWITRRAPFGEANLIDTEFNVNFNEVTTENDIVTVIATRPLTDNECWTKLAPEEYVLFKLGVQIH